MNKWRRWSEKELNLLKDLYPHSSWPVILKKIKRSKQNIKAKANCLNMIRLGKKFEMTPEIQEIIDGLVIGDGNLSLVPSKTKGTGMLMIQQRQDRVSWLIVLKQELKKHSIEYSPLYFCNDGIHNSVTLRTHCYINFKNQYYRWYPNKIKRLPDDLQFTDKILAYWYMGDGSLMKNGTNKGNKIMHFVIKLATLNFSKEENQLLIKKLNEKYGYRFRLSHDHKWGKKYYSIGLRYEKDIIAFLQRTIRFKVKCFDYKWRYLDYMLSHKPSKEHCRWTKEDEIILKEKYSTQSYEIPELLKRYTKRQIYVKAQHMGLLLTEEKRKERKGFPGRTRQHPTDCKCATCRTSRGEYRGKNNPHYGKVPWNKGLHGEEYLKHFN